MTKYDKQTPNKKDIYYDILENGYKIYIGQTQRALYYQYEPYIPDPSKSYEENAKDICAELAKERTNPEADLDVRLTNIEANIDYLMLLNDADSIDASEE